MAATNHIIPKFGEWDVDNPVQYTQVFEGARAGKYPIPGMEPYDSSGAKYTTPMARARQEKKRLDDEIDTRKGETTSESVRSEPVARPKPVNDREAGILRTSSADAPGRRPRMDKENSSTPSLSPGAERSSMLQARAARGVVTPSGEGRRPRSIVGDEGSAPSKARAVHSKLDEGGLYSEKGGALPKFGEWNTLDPSAGAAYTAIFNHASDERKQGGSLRVPQSRPGSPDRNEGDLYNQSGRKSKKQNKFLCCFIPSFE